MKNLIIYLVLLVFLQACGGKRPEKTEGTADNYSPQTQETAPDTISKVEILPEKKSKKPDAVKPTVTPPDIEKPDVVPPTVTLPDIEKPDIIQPVVTQPDATETELEKDLNSLKLGQIIFNPPTEMQVAKTQRIEVRISRDTSGQTQITMKKNLKGEGQIQQATVKTGSVMSVRLQGAKFKITSLSSEMQPVTKNDFAEWKFDVTPEEGGKHELALHVSVRLRGETYGEVSKDFPVMEKQIDVKVDTTAVVQSFFAGHWEWFASTLLIPVFFWWRGRRKV